MSSLIGKKLAGFWFHDTQLKTAALLFPMLLLDYNLPEQFTFEYGIKLTQLD